MMNQRHLVQNIKSGDVFVIEVDGAGMVIGESDVLHYSEWQEPNTNRPRADLDLDAYDLWPLDPKPDTKYRYLTR